MSVLGHASPGGDVLVPVQMLPIALAAVLYGRRVRTLRARGTIVPAWRVTMFAVALGLIVLALVSPIAELAEAHLFSIHMVQHLLLGDLAPLALLAGLTGPVLRPVLALPAVIRLRALAHPAVALPIRAVNLCVWHLPVLYDGALRHSALHGIEHAAFFTAGIVMWAPVFEVLPAPAWFGSGAKLAYIVVVRLVGTALANVFLWAESVFYETYERAGGHWGVSPLADQGIAGGVMMVEGSLVTIAAFAWLFLRMAGEGELRQELLERGLDPRAVNRAVRYGRGRELS